MYGETRHHLDAADFQYGGSVTDRGAVEPERGSFYGERTIYDAFERLSDAGSLAEMKDLFSGVDFTYSLEEWQSIEEKARQLEGELLRIADDRNSDLWELIERSMEASAWSKMGTIDIPSVMHNMLIEHVYTPYIKAIASGTADEEVRLHVMEHMHRSTMKIFPPAGKSVAEDERRRELGAGYRASVEAQQADEYARWVQQQKERTPNVLRAAHEYLALHAEYIETLEQQEQETLVDSILDMLESAAGHRAMMEGAVTSLERVPNMAAARIFARLRNEDSPIMQDTYSRILHRLELGKIGISENVVQYFDLQYTVQNKGEVTYARRITRDGKIGLMTDSGSLEAYFELGDLVDSTLERQVVALEVTREQLLTDPNTPDDVRTQFLRDYKVFCERTFGEVEGVRVTDLQLREQMWMYQFAERHPEMWPLVQEVKALLGLGGIKLFIALEKDQHAGEYIKMIIDRYPADIVKKITTQFGALLSYVEGIDEHIDTELGNAEKRSLVNAGKVTSILGEKMVELLRASAAEGVTQEMLEQKLALLPADVSFIGALYKEASQLGMSSEEFDHLHFSVQPGSTLSKADKTELLRLKDHAANDVAKTGIEDAVLNEANRNKNAFVTMKFDGESGETTLSMMRIERREKGRVYVGSFIIDRAARGMNMANEMMARVLSMLRKENTIELTVVPEASFGTKYIEALGAIATNYRPEVSGTSVGLFDMEIPKAGELLPSMLKGKQVETLQQFEHKLGQEIDFSAPAYMLRAHMQDSSVQQALLEQAQLLFNAGYVMTRYLCASDDCAERVFGFERLLASANGENGVA